MNNKDCRIGDLVMHIRDKRYGVIMSDPAVFHGLMAGIWVCRVAWLGSQRNNLMDLDFLKKIVMEEK
jgi:hypothetical protein